MHSPIARGAWRVARSHRRDTDCTHRSGSGRARIFRCTSQHTAVAVARPVERGAMQAAGVTTVVRTGREAPTVVKMGGTTAASLAVATAVQWVAWAAAGGAAPREAEEATRAVGRLAGVWRAGAVRGAAMVVAARERGMLAVDWEAPGMMVAAHSGMAGVASTAGQVAVEAMRAAAGAAAGSLEVEAAPAALVVLRADRARSHGRGQARSACCHSAPPACTTQRMAQCCRCRSRIPSTPSGRSAAAHAQQCTSRRTMTSAKSGRPCPRRGPRWSGRPCARARPCRLRRSPTRRPRGRCPQQRCPIRQPAAMEWAVGRRGLPLRGPAAHGGRRARRWRRQRSASAHVEVDGRGPGGPAAGKRQEKKGHRRSRQVRDIQQTRVRPKAPHSEAHSTPPPTPATPPLSHTARRRA